MYQVILMIQRNGTVDLGVRACTLTTESFYATSTMVSQLMSWIFIKLGCNATVIILCSLCSKELSTEMRPTL